MSNGKTGTDVVSAGDRAVNQPADRAVGYGQKAVAQATRVAQAPPGKQEPPPHVLLAKQALAALFPNDPVMKNVKLYDLATRAPSDVLRRNARLVGAWTNSSKEIYVTPGVDTIELAYSVMYHESRHIVQFAEHGGPPATYVQMLEYERDAYGQTIRFLELRRNVANKVGYLNSDQLRDQIAINKTHEDWFLVTIEEVNELPADEREAYAVSQLTLGDDRYLPLEVQEKELPVIRLYTRP